MSPAKTSPGAGLQDAPADTVDYQARSEELTRELAKLKAAHARQLAEPAPVPPPRDTHVLVLSNGETVQTAAPVATHHSTEDGTFLVVGRYELPREVD